MQLIRVFRARQILTSDMAYLLEQQFVYRSFSAIPGPFHCSRLAHRIDDTPLETLEMKEC